MILYQMILTRYLKNSIGFSPLREQIFLTQLTIPNDFIPPNPNPPNLTLGITSPATVNTTIHNFTTKHSTDLDGISTYLLKSVSLGICTPLSHIFNLSINQGIFPTKLKKSRTVSIFKSGNPKYCNATTTDQSLCSHPFPKFLKKLSQFN